MKRIFALLLAVLLTVGMCACGAEQIINVDATEGEVDTAAIRAEFDKADALIGSLIDADALGMTASMQDEYNGTDLYKYWAYDDFAGNDEFSMDVELDGKTFTVGKTTVGELKEMGYEFDISEETVPAENSLGFSVTKGDRFCSLTADNSTGKKQSVYDLPVTEFNSFNPEYAIDMTYSGVKLGDSLKDVLDQFGIPRDSIKLSADSANTSIELDYYNEKTESDATIAHMLTIYLSYDAEADNAAVSSLSIRQSTYPLFPDDTAE